MAMIRFSAQKIPPPPVMGRAVDCPDLKQCPIELHVNFLDSFTNNPDDFITHGDLVNAALAREMMFLGWNPASLTIVPTEFFNEKFSKLTNTKKLWKKIIQQSKESKNYIGMLSSAGLQYKTNTSYPLEETLKNMRKNISGFNIVSTMAKKISAWPCFIAADNAPNCIDYLSCQKSTIAVATTKQKEQENHRGIANQFVDGCFSAKIAQDGLDFNEDGTTDYKCKIYDDTAIGKIFLMDCNSFAAPVAFAHYACRLMEELSKAPEKAAQRLKQLNLYDFAFPNLETYKKHDSYGKNGYRGKQYPNLTEAVA